MHGWRVNRPQMGVVINIMCSPLWRGPIFTRCLPYGPPFEVYHSTINSILQRAALLNAAAEHLKHYAHHGSRVCLLNSRSLQSGMGRALLHTGHTCCASSKTLSLVCGLCFYRRSLLSFGGCSGRQGLYAHIKIWWMKIWNKNLKMLSFIPEKFLDQEGL